MDIEVGLLGPVELRLGGEPAPLSGAPQRVLLARLALAGGRIVPVADLIDALWDGEPPENALGNLHSYVSRLRRHTGEALCRAPGGYRLGLAPGALDTERVERLVAIARTQQPERAAATFAEALAVWRGDPLADVAERIAFAPEVARLAEWRRQLREECLGVRIDAGGAADALPEVEALATAEPLRERPHLLLMRALHQTGRSPEALAVARAFRDRIADGHGLDPSPELAVLQQRILGEDPGLRPTPPPAPRRRADRFIGRRAELAAVREALATHRITTLVGPGGVGKTRLMTEALAGGELVVELAERSAAEDVATAVAAAIGLRAGGRAALVERLGAAPVVLVLDNCEHLVEAVRVLVDEVVARCPRVRVLATSRQRLGAAGERVLRIGPLPAEDRVALFCDRAALLRADFDDSPRTRRLAAEICDLVDGLPLAVELAARREAVFGLTHLRDRLGAGLHVLDPARGGDRATAVSATVEWSYRLLDPAAQALLDRLAVCRGGFGVDALPYLQENGEQLLAELVDASLVGCDVSGDAPRYRLLETVRHVALGHLDPQRERQARDAHARWMLRHAEELLDRGRDRDPWTTPALRREMANLRAALAWLSDRDDGARLAALLAVVGSDAPDPGLTEQLAGFAPARVSTETEALRALAAGTAEWLRGRLSEADGLLTAALDRLPADHPLRAGALLIRISNAMFAGRAEDVRADAARMAADPGAARWARATGICCAALMDAYAGDPEAGQRWLEKHAEHLDTDGLDGFVPFTRGELLAGRAPAQALAWYDRSIAASERVNQVYMANIARVGRAAALIRLGRHDAAIAACREALAAVRAAWMIAQVWTTLRLVAELLAELGDPEGAATIVYAAQADPLAPAVMGPDRERLARIRAAVPAAPPPPADGGPTALSEYALARLDRSRGARTPIAAG